VHGGNEVYVTGSFNAWQGKILMYPNEDGEFTLLIDIPPGTHHYKYIVDQEWSVGERRCFWRVDNLSCSVATSLSPDHSRCFVLCASL
jgi:1,4-alpha-glucan branching enzyme